MEHHNKSRLVALSRHDLWSMFPDRFGLDVYDFDINDYPRLIQYVRSVIDPNFKQGDIVTVRDETGNDRGSYISTGDSLIRLDPNYPRIPEEFLVPLQYPAYYWWFENGMYERNFTANYGKNVYLSLPGLGQLTTANLYLVDNRFIVFPFISNGRVIYIGVYIEEPLTVQAGDRIVEEFGELLNRARIEPTLVSLRTVIDDIADTYVPPPQGIPLEDLILISLAPVVPLELPIDPEPLDGFPVEEFFGVLQRFPETSVTRRNDGLVVRAVDRALAEELEALGLERIMVTPNGAGGFVYYLFAPGVENFDAVYRLYLRRNGVEITDRVPNNSFIYIREN